jgi:hypothetical protein
MLSWRPRAYVVMLLLLAAAACKKEGDLPSDLRPRAAAVDVDKLVVPPMFAAIPADSPYVFASFEAMPLGHFAKFKRALGPAFGRAFDKLRFGRGTDSTAARWIDAIADELDGKWDAKGFESLGFSAAPRFAVYGHGALPIVMRIEIADGKKLLATVERVAARAGATLPALENRHGREFWRIELPDDDGAVVMIHEKELVAAAGPRRAIADVLPQILGAEAPPKNMADGKALKQLISKHGLGAQFVGYVDGKRLADAVVAIAPRRPPQDCITEIDRLVANAPRFVFGYTELTDKRIAGSMILELAPAIVEQLKNMKAEVPGLGAALGGDPLFAFGGGIDLAEAKRAGKAIAYVLNDLGEACDARELTRAGRDLREAMSKPLPGPVSKITGGVISIAEIEMPGGSRGRRSFRPKLPEKLEGFAMLTAADPKALFEAISDEARLGKLGIKADGKLHAVDIPSSFVPFEIHAGVGDSAIVVTAGERGKKLGDKALGYSGGGKAPFLAMAMDYGRFLEMTTQLGSALDPDPVTRELNEALAGMFGRAVMTIDATDQGLAWWFSMELK